MNYSHMLLQLIEMSPLFFHLALKGLEFFCLLGMDVHGLIGGFTADKGVLAVVESISHGPYTTDL